MGIDAHIVIRKVPKAVVTEEWLKERSWRLCEAIAAKHFFISDGLPPAEYDAATKAWHKAFDTHALHDEWEASRGDHQKWSSVRERIIADIGDPPKDRRLAIERVGERHREAGDPDPGTHYSDDGPVEIVAKNGECLLKLNLWGRYYGPGYERGDILTYCAIAEWLEQNIQGCEVWYGGDSSGVEIKRFDSKYREELRKHLYSQEGRDYFARDWMGDGKTPRPKACSLCPGGKYRGSQFGSGPSFASFHCAGCGKSVETRDNGHTWQERKEG